MIRRDLSGELSGIRFCGCWITELEFSPLHFRGPFAWRSHGSRVRSQLSLIRGCWHNRRRRTIDLGRIKMQQLLAPNLTSPEFSFRLVKIHVNDSVTKIDIAVDVMGRQCSDYFTRYHFTRHCGYYSIVSCYILALVMCSHIIWLYLVEPVRSLPEVLKSHAFQLYFEICSW